MNTIPLRKGRRTVIDLINRDNGTSFRYGRLDMGDPIPLLNKPRNTALHVWEKVQSQYKPGVTVWYNRLDVKKVFEMMWGETALLQLDVSGCSRLSELIDVLNKAYSFELVPEDIVDIELDPDVPYTFAELQMSNKSHLYVGVLPVHLYNIDLSKVRLTSDGRIRLNDDGTIRYIN